MIEISLLEEKTRFMVGAKLRSFKRFKKKNLHLDLEDDEEFKIDEYVG